MLGCLAGRNANPRYTCSANCAVTIGCPCGTAEVTAGTAKRVEQMFHLNAESVKKQLELTHQLDFLKYPNHPAIVKHEIPLSIGGGMGSHAR